MYYCLCINKVVFPSTFQLVTVTTQTFVDLAKVSVILEQMQLDELVYEQSHFLAYYTELQEQGVYWLLCQLHKLSLSSGSEISRDIVREVENLQLDSSLSDRALRHMRDYIILRDLQRLLYRISVTFAVLAEQQSSEVQHSRRRRHHAG